jgi:hypothetical protein
MQFVSDYMKGIDLIALAALVAIAVAPLYRQGSIWLLIAAICRSHLGCKSVVWSVLTDLFTVLHSSVTKKFQRSESKYRQAHPARQIAPANSKGTIGMMCSP